MNVTRAQAEQVLQIVKSRFASRDADGTPVGPQPELVENWDWLESAPTRWAIVWEEGPEEWALRDLKGLPEGIWLEPVTRWAVSVLD